jgi:hypothetical protein
VCGAGVAPALDDGDDCTVDACDPGEGVTHTPKPKLGMCGYACPDGYHVSEYTCTVECGPCSGPHFENWVLCLPDC